MDKFTGAFNSFTGGDNNNQQQGQYSQGQEQGGNQGGYSEGNQQTQQSRNNNGGGGAGDFLGGLGFGGGNNQQGQQGQGQNQGQSSGDGFLGGLGDKFNSAAGGGRESEKNEDYLDKGEFILLYLSGQYLVNMELTSNRHRYGAGKIHGPGTAGQRECY